LNRTVAELEVSLDHAEYVDWMALDSLRAHERETAERQAKKGMRPRR
jgi:hypothetical protein